jgi:signal transduction histidine kinase
MSSTQRLPNFRLLASERVLPEGAPLILVATSILACFLFALEFEWWSWQFHGVGVIGLLCCGFGFEWYRQRIDELAAESSAPISARLLQTATICALCHSVLLIGIVLASFHAGDDLGSLLLTASVIGWSTVPLYSLGRQPRLWAALVVPVLSVLAARWLLSNQTRLGLFAGFLCAVVCAGQYALLIICLNAQKRLQTDRNEAISKIRQLTDEGDQATKLRQIAEQANQAKSRFLASASHDLRQPLTALSLFSATLNHTAKDPQIVVLAKHIDNTVNTLENLFNSLLDLSKLDAGVVTACPTRVNIRAMLERLKIEYYEQATTKGLQLICESEPAWIHTDPVLFERILRNLLENALRYTSTGNVLLRCQIHLEKAMIEVSDTGPGIVASERERVFDEYYQINNPGRDRSQGLGIGLSIVRKLCDLLALDLVLESVVGKGSTFRLLSPTCEKPQHKPIESAVQSSFIKPLSGLSILVIDDDQEIRCAVQMVLELNGCLVLSAKNISEALQLCGFTPPDIVIADYRLAEGENGLEALHLLKTRFGQIKGLVLTGDTGPERLREVAESGYPILHKPINGPTLLARIKTISSLNNAGAAQLIAEQARVEYRL